MSVAEFRTISRPCTGELEVQRSRFIAYLSPAETEAAARASIAGARADHPKSRHVCSAFVLGPDAQTTRSNDDGEPSGTAGKPILDALVGNQLTNVVAIVVRYFGGTLLGAGGLTRTYRAVVADTIATSAEIVTMVATASATITCDYASAERVKNAVAMAGAQVVDNQYAENVTLTIAVAPSDLAKLQRIVGEIVGQHQPLVSTDAIVYRQR